MMYGNIDLGEPDNRYGYRMSTLAKLLPEDRFLALNHWMRGQTMALVEGDKGMDTESVVYPHDLQRWCDAGRIID